MTSKKISHESHETGTVIFGVDRCQFDCTIRAIRDTVAATDTGVINEHLAINRTVDGIGRTVLHALRIFAMTASCGHMNVGVGYAGLPLQT